MSDTLTVRDHSQPCEHPQHAIVREKGTKHEYVENLGAHLFFDQPSLPDYWICGDDECPGGREIVLPAPAAWERERYNDLWRAVHRGTVAPWARDIDRALTVVFDLRGWEVPDETSA